MGFGGLLDRSKSKSTSKSEDILRDNRKNANGRESKMKKAGERKSESSGIK
jgi:hypothetical protein